MLPSNFQAVAAILLAIAPGFIATSVWSRARTWKGPSGDLRTALQSLALSGVVQLVLSPLTLWWLLPVRRHLLDHQVRVVIWLLLAVFVVPVGGGIAIGKLGDWLFGSSSSFSESRIGRAVGRIWPGAPPPSVWDWLFTVRPPYGSFVVVEYDDGRQVAGVFAEGSVALTSPEPHGLYLVSEWSVDEDGNVLEPVPDSGGVMLIATDGIRAIRILKGEEDG